jgi:hypothetical protein
MAGPAADEGYLRATPVLERMLESLDSRPIHWWPRLMRPRVAKADASAAGPVRVGSASMVMTHT